MKVMTLSLRRHAIQSVGYGVHNPHNLITQGHPRDNGNIQRLLYLNPITTNKEARNDG